MKSISLRTQFNMQENNVSKDSRDTSFSLDIDNYAKLDITVPPNEVALSILPPGIGNIEFFLLHTDSDIIVQTTNSGTPLPVAAGGVFLITKSGVGVDDILVTTDSTKANIVLYVADTLAVDNGEGE